MTLRHFLTLRDCAQHELHYILQRAITLKHMRTRGTVHEPLRGKVLGMIFEKSSTRTRVSFEAGMAQLGGSSIFLSPRDTQLGRGEPIEDAAKVLSRMIDVVMIRTFAHQKLECFAENSRIPVINGLSNDYHPCQLLADIQAYVEHRGSIQGRDVAWIGDGNNMCQSYIEAAVQFDFNLRIACPAGYQPLPEIVKLGGKHLVVMDDPREAAAGADLLVTDVWTSMGQEDEEKERRQAFQRYQVNAALMKTAKPDALFMHCLPAHRGEEVTAEVIDGTQSIVWDEAENRLHAQKALLEFLLLGPQA
jgi:ornithine carbamoyltransferase